MNELKIRKSPFPKVLAKLSNLKVKFGKIANIQKARTELETLKQCLFTKKKKKSYYYFYQNI